MAEHSFQEVMRQLNRLCSHYHNCGESGCPMRGCLMFDECWNIGTHCSDPKHSYRIEKIVMGWAAEHPEPVYPTWKEWLSEQGILSAGGLWEKAFKPIPAEIAEKLGLEPKEGA